MDLKVIPKKGKRGRHRWLIQDMENQEMTVGMSPRDWIKAEDAVDAGEALLDARADVFKAKIGELEADLETRNKQLTAETGRISELTEALGLTEAKAVESRDEAAKLKNCNAVAQESIKGWREENTRLDEQLDAARRDADLLRMDRKRDKRAVIIAYTVVFAAVFIGASCILINGAFGS